jgi:uracil-DNA glycosylase
MSGKDPVAVFVKRLSDFRVPEPYQDNLRNPYLNPLQRENLRIYLTVMRRQRPRVLLVGRDPGYRGCALTGIPFTSEAIVARGTLPSGEPLACSGAVVGPGVGYRIPSDRPSVSEASASIIWEGIHRYFQAPPLLWNALPFHPHHPGNHLSNRTPALAAETLAFGKPYLLALFDLFPSLDTVYFLRHPSHGGKRDFFAQLSRLKKEGRI